MNTKIKNLILSGLIVLFFFSNVNSVNAGFLSDVFADVKNWGSAGLGIGRFFLANAQFQFLNNDKNNLPTSFITCGETFTIQAEDYEGSEVWLEQMKDGASRYEGVINLPLTYKSVCGQDEGRYVNRFYSYDDGEKGEKIGDVRFTIKKMKVSCSLSVNKRSFLVGEEIEFNINSNPAGLNAYWVGGDISNSNGIFAGQTPYNLNYTFQENDIGRFTRQAIIKNQNGNAVCSTRKVSIRVRGAAYSSPTTSSTLSPTVSPTATQGQSPTATQNITTPACALTWGNPRKSNGVALRKIGDTSNVRVEIRGFPPRTLIAIRSENLITKKPIAQEFTTDSNGVVSFTDSTVIKADEYSVGPYKTEAIDVSTMYMRLSKERLATCSPGFEIIP